MHPPRSGEGHIVSPLSVRTSVTLCSIVLVSATPPTVFMSPTKGEGGHISFSADPGRRRDSLYPPYFLKQWVEFYQTCLDTLLGQAKELI